MRLKLDPFEGFMILSVRGDVKATEVRILTVGMLSLLKKDSPNIIFNLSRAQLDATTVHSLSQLKRVQAKINEKAKIVWIYKDRAIGDYPSIEVFFSQITGSRFRQMSEKVHLEDEMDELQETKISLEKKLKSLSGDESTGDLVVIENFNLKMSKRIFDSMMKWQRAKLKEQIAIPAQNVEASLTIAEGRKIIADAILKTGFVPAGKDIEL